MCVVMHFSGEFGKIKETGKKNKAKQIASKLLVKSNENDSAIIKTSRHTYADILNESNGINSFL